MEPTEKKELGNSRERKNSRAAWEYAAAFSSTFLVACCGTMSGWTSPSLPKLLSKGSPIPLTLPQASWLASIGAAGGIVGPPLAVNLVDRLGRRKALLLAVVPTIVSWALIIIAKDVTILYVARFLGGITIGLTNSLGPMYVGEIASTRMRGRLGMLFAVMFNVGLVFAFVIGPWVGIRTMAGICLAQAMLYVLLFWKMPESPYFLAMNGRFEETRAVLVKLRGKNDVTEEFESIVGSTKQDRINCDTDDLSSPIRRSSASSSSSSSSSTLRNKLRTTGRLMNQLIFDRASRKALFIIVLICFSQHFGGFFIVNCYSQLIFEKINNTEISPDVASILMTVIQLVTVVIVVTFVDRLGRKPLLAFSGLLSSISTFFLSLYFLASEIYRVDVSDYSRIAVGTLLVYVFAVSAGILPVHTILLSELFDTNIKAIASCVSTIFAFTIAAVALKFYIIFTAEFGHFALFAVFTFILVTTISLMLYILPETKGKLFDEIQRNLGTYKDNINASASERSNFISMK